jgi:hypothetical protein
MELPKKINNEVLVKRVKKLIYDGQHKDSEVPDSVIIDLERMLDNITSGVYDLKELSCKAGNILSWYFDRGFKEKKAHKEISDFSLDIVKIYELQKSLIDTQSLVNDSETPKEISELVELIRNLLMSVNNDASFVEDISNKFYPRLREIRVLHREFLEKRLDRTIFLI